VLRPCSPINEEGGCVDVARARGDGGLRQLQVAERRAEQPACARALEGLMQSTTGEPERRCADGRAKHVERRHGNLEPLAGPTEPVRDRDAYALEAQRCER